MLMRFDPFREIDEVFRAAGAGARVLRMPMDAYRRGDHLLVEVDLPGVDRDSIELTVERNVLHVAAERRHHWREHDEVLVAERADGRVTREIFLGDSLATDGIRADYRDGVLSVRIPVAEEAKPRRIAIGEAGDGAVHEVEAAVA